MVPRCLNFDKLFNSASTNLESYRASDVSNWTKLEATLQAKASDAKARLQLTTTKKGVIWFDQVSLMPTDTYKVCLHGAKFLVVSFHLKMESFYGLGVFSSNIFSWYMTFD